MSATIAAEVTKHVRTRLNGAAPRRRRKTRAETTAVQSRLIGLLDHAQNGLSIREIVKDTKLARGVVMYHLKALRRQKLVRMIGKRSQAVWLL